MNDIVKMALLLTLGHTLTGCGASRDGYSTDSAQLMRTSSTNSVDETTDAPDNSCIAYDETEFLLDLFAVVLDVDGADNKADTVIATEIGRNIIEHRAYWQRQLNSTSQTDRMNAEKILRDLGRFEQKIIADSVFRGKAVSRAKQLDLNPNLEIEYCVQAPPDKTGDPIILPGGLPNK